MQQARSNFVTIPGLVILLVLALAAAYAGIGLLFAALAALFLLCLISRLWAGSALKKIDLDVDDRGLCGFPGDELCLPVKVSNDKFLPVIWLSVDLGIGEDECVSPGEDGQAAFSWIMPHQKLSWDEPLKAVRRGVRRIASVDMVSGDGFGLAWSSSTEPLEDGIEVCVFPALIPADITVLVRKLSEMEPYSRGWYTDQTLVKSTAPYTPGESIRDISWRMLARQGELIVNKKEKLDTRRMCLVLDLESFSEEFISESGSGPVTVYSVRKDELEHMLSVAASIADAASSSGVRVSLVIPGCGERRANIVCPEEAELQAEALFRALAAVDYGGGPCVMPYEQISEEHHRLGQLFCLTRTADGCADRFWPDDAAVWYISPDGAGQDHVIAEEDILR